jgi:hypothetical protein
LLPVAVAVAAALMLHITAQEVAEQVGCLLVAPQYLLRLIQSQLALADLVVLVQTTPVIEEIAETIRQHWGKLPQVAVEAMVD